MYTIKEAASRSGVTIPTLRAWERRYGVVHPVRTTSGYRLYDEDAIARLRAMRALVVDGWTASQAARHVLASAVTDLPAPVPSSLDRPTARSAVAGALSLADGSASIRDGLVDAALRLDSVRLDDLLDETFGRLSFERAMRHVVFPVLHEVGRAWERGEMGIAAEHAASHAVVRRLARLYDAAHRGEGAPRAVLGLPAGSLHEIGLLAFAVAARRIGVPVLYLGANVPAASWAAALDRTGADIAVVGVPTIADVRAAGEVVDALAARPRPPAIMLGGAGAAGGPDRSGVLRLPMEIDAAADALAAAVPARSRPGRRARRAAAGPG